MTFSSLQGHRIVLISRIDDPLMVLPESRQKLRSPTYDVIDILELPWSSMRCDLLLRKALYQTIDRYTASILRAGQIHIDDSDPRRSTDLLRMASTTTAHPIPHPEAVQDWVLP